MPTYLSGSAIVLFLRCGGQNAGKALSSERPCMASRIDGATGSESLNGTGTRQWERIGPAGVNAVCVHLIGGKNQAFEAAS